MTAVEPTIPDRRARARPALVRDAFDIVLTGVVLGVAFNTVQLMSQPPRGLPWIAVARRLDNVDSLVSLAPNATVPAPSPGTVGAPPPPQPIANVREAPRSALPPRERLPSPAAGTAPRAVAQPPAVTNEPRAGLPVIPDVARPLRVELPTVVKYVEAGAALVVDAREAVEFADGHIPGAVNIPYDDAVRDPSRVANLEDGGRPIIVYCSGGTCEASLLLAEMMMRDFNKRGVLVYEAGFPEWAAAGRPVAKVNP